MKIQQTRLETCKVDISRVFTVLANVKERIPWPKSRRTKAVVLLAQVYPFFSSNFYLLLSFWFSVERKVITIWFRKIWLLDFLLFLRFFFSFFSSSLNFFDQERLSETKAKSFEKIVRKSNRDKKKSFCKRIFL